MRSNVISWFVVCAVCLCMLGGVGPSKAASPSFADFQARAEAGEQLSVVFFGASLTYGANATDPILTSYRGCVADRLREAYPKARFRFWDAAIGGTGSQLAVFRMDRDVFSHHPDLVFVDFSANDDINSATDEPLASYEAILRRVIQEAHCPVVQVIFPFKWDIAPGKMEKMSRRTAHLALAEAYHCAVGDAIALTTEKVTKQEMDINKIWDLDAVHPGNAGYALFAQAAWQGFQDAVRDKRVCTVPEKMLHADTYMHSRRVRISSLAPLPAGWKVGQPNRVSAYFDMLMSRWLDDLVIAAPGADRLKLRFEGSALITFGEGTPKSGKYRVYVDGKLIKQKGFGPGGEIDAGSVAIPSRGNTHHTANLVDGLDASVPHTLEIEPVLTAGQELRLESICVAGGKAEVTPATQPTR